MDKSRRLGTGITQTSCQSLSISSVQDRPVWFATVVLPPERLIIILTCVATCTPLISTNHLALSLLHARSLSLSFLLRPLPLITYFTFFLKIFIYDVLICLFIWFQNLSVCWYFISISCVLKFERKVRKWVKHMWHISENMAGIGTDRFQISMSKFPATIFSNILLYIYIYIFCSLGSV